jgi:BirA family biotin operon repressor/biotin-[acetyl-CoA-carboxylase] ligase
VKHLHFESVDSTMETARREAGNASATDFLLVTAEGQTSGRGTRGRPWHSPKGNVYLTLAIRRTLLAPDRLGLFPLETGLAIWEATAAQLPPAARASLRLKWPNDLLWEGRKAAGMLLEATGDHIFVGVGINLAEAPEVTDGGTPSGRLADAGIGEDAGLELAKSFAGNLRDRLMPEALDGMRTTVEDWRARALWNKPLRLRDRPTRPEVFPVDLNAEGHLKVRFSDGHEEWLVSEYLA